MARGPGQPARERERGRGGGARVPPLDPGPLRFLILVSAASLLLCGFLTWDHQLALLDPRAVSGLCAPGSGCEISRTSPWSEIRFRSGFPGAPISLLGAASAIAALLLVGLALRGPQARRRSAARLLLGQGALAVAYSLVLAVVSLQEQHALCPWCASLYALNLLHLGLAWFALREAPGVAVRGAFAALPGPAGWGAFAAFAAVLVAGYAVYARPLLAARDERESLQIARDLEALRTPPRSFDSAGRPSLGPAAAPGRVVHVIEFADFECPYCRLLFEVLESARAARPDSLRVTFMHFPLNSSCNPALGQPIHPGACRLAAAAECAHAQGRFFDLAPWLFEFGRVHDREGIVKGAAARGLDEAAFRTCLDAPETLERVRNDAIRGAGAGVQATPTFFVDGHRIEGARSLDVVLALVDAALERAGR